MIHAESPIPVLFANDTIKDARIITVGSIRDYRIVFDQIAISHRDTKRDIYLPVGNSKSNIFKAYSVRLLALGREAFHVVKEPVYEMSIDFADGAIFIIPIIGHAAMIETSALLRGLSITQAVDCFFRFKQSEYHSGLFRFYTNIEYIGVKKL